MSVLPQIHGFPDWYYGTDEIPWPKLLHQKRLTISHSSRGSLGWCSRFFELQKLYWVTRFEQGNDDLPAEVGQALHVGFQKWLETGKEDDALWAYMRRYPIQLCSDMENERSLEAGANTLLKMTDNVQLVGWEIAQIIVDGQPRPAIEVPFEIELVGFTVAGMPVYYTGLIDAILWGYLNKRYRVWDIKTTRRHLKNIDAEYKYNGQQIPYGLVVQQIQNAPIEAFDVSYLHTFVDLLEPSAQPFTYSKTAADINDWLMRLVLDLRKLDQMVRMQYFPRTEQGCTTNFGRPCRFFDICHMRDPAELQKMLLPLNVVLAPDDWNPWIKIKLDVGEWV